jgi:hypothetical protein
MVCVTSPAFSQKIYYKINVGLQAREMHSLSFPLFRFSRKNSYKELEGLKVKGSEMVKILCGSPY